MEIAKYSASGNDFVIFHSFIKKERNALAKKLCDRKEGIGADGLIVLVPHEKEAYEWEFYNADGSIAEMCGNGSRAAAHYAVCQGLALAKHSFVTLAGVIKVEVKGDVVKSDLTPPNILDDSIEYEGQHYWKIDTGVPHLVTFVEDITSFDLQKARSLRQTYNANVNIGQIQDDGSIKVRTYERGVEDETLACGTGMAAVFYRANKEGRCENRVKVYPKSNETLLLALENETITFEGSVRRVFETNYYGEDL